MDSTLKIRLKGSALDPDSSERVIHQKRPDSDQPLYRVYLYLEGHDLPYVRAVTYHLDPSFSKPVQRVSRSARNPRCKLRIWTWGLFLVTATVEDKKGRRHTFTHQLQYDKDFKLPGVSWKVAEVGKMGTDYS